MSYAPRVTSLELEHVVTAAADLRYQGPDRRSRPTPFLSRYTFFGGRRRGGGRRLGENSDVFVDQHGEGLFLVVLSIVTLNFLDAWFTIYQALTFDSSRDALRARTGR